MIELTEEQRAVLPPHLARRYDAYEGRPFTSGQRALIRSIAKSRLESKEYYPTEEAWRSAMEEDNKKALEVEAEFLSRLPPEDRLKLEEHFG